MPFDIAGVITGFASQVLRMETEDDNGNKEFWVKSIEPIEGNAMRVTIEASQSEFTLWALANAGLTPSVLRSPKEYRDEVLEDEG